MYISALAGNSDLASVYREMYSARIVRKADTTYNNTLKSFNTEELLKRINNNKVKEGEEKKSNIVYSEEKTDAEKAVGTLIDVEA